MNELEIIDDIKIENMIYEVRGKQVILDSDLAKLYHCSNGTKSINLAVKRNIEKFPNRFMFRLTTEEYNQILRFQNETLELKQGKYSKYLPYAFTEQGVAMLATVLKTPVAINVSIAIMDAFVIMRKYISTNLLEQKYINDLVLQNTEDIKLLKQSFSNFKELTNEIYFEGQIYDAYSKIKDILSMAKKELIIIDAYADKVVLDMIKDLSVKVTLIVKNKSLLTKTDINKYKSQYSNLNIIYDDTFHDRYFIIDNDIIYHCGTSINHAGSKTFSINKLEDEIVKESLINKINNLKTQKIKI